MYSSNHQVSFSIMFMFRNNLDYEDGTDVAWCLAIKPRMLWPKWGEVWILLWKQCFDPIRNEFNEVSGLEWSRTHLFTCLDLLRRIEIHHNTLMRAEPHWSKIEMMTWTWWLKVTMADVEPDVEWWSDGRLNVGMNLSMVGPSILPPTFVLNRDQTWILITGWWQHGLRHKNIGSSRCLKPRACARIHYPNWR